MPLPGAQALGGRRLASAAGPAVCEGGTPRACEMNVRFDGFERAEGAAARSEACPGGRLEGFPCGTRFRHLQFAACASRPSLRSREEPSSGHRVTRSPRGQVVVTCASTAAARCLDAWIGCLSSSSLAHSPRSTQAVSGHACSPSVVGARGAREVEAGRGPEVGQAPRDCDAASYPPPVERLRTCFSTFRPPAVDLAANFPLRAWISSTVPSGSSANIRSVMPASRGHSRVHNLVSTRLWTSGSAVY